MAEPARPAPRGTAEARAAWVLFDWAAQPFFTVVTTFLFAPYFAATVAPDTVTGQAMWGWAVGLAGLAIALGGPVFGAVADVQGARKGWVFAFSLLLVGGASLLYLATPDGEAPILVVLIAFAVATIGAEYATVFTNAMLPDLALPGRLGRLSGTGFAFGYLGGLVSLALVIALVVADPDSGLTLAGIAPVFGIDADTREGERLLGPLSAAWYVLFVVPLFLFVKEAPAARRFGEAVVYGLRQLVASLSALRRRRSFLGFLIARMLYQDGLNALFAFGGIYAAGTFDWTATELGLFGILLLITGTVGALMGGTADDRFGPRRVVALSLIGLIAVGTLILSIERDSVLWMIPVTPEGEGLFATPSEQLYLALGVVLGGLAGPIQASSRTLLVRLAPEGEMTEAFGLYALSGKLTAFVAPLAVGTVTALSGSQRVGIAVILVFLAAGLALLVRLRGVR